MAVPETFSRAYDDYLTDAREARAADKSESFRTQLFLGFLSDAFNIKANQVSRERCV